MDIHRSRATPRYSLIGITDMKNSNARLWFYNLLFIVILLVAGYFRLIGLNWDQSQHLHPDERFMTMVESALEPVSTFSDYFNTDTSSLNPHNRGFNFYVYGDLPVTIVRYTAAWLSDISLSAQKYVQNNGTEGMLAPLMLKLGSTTNWAGYDEVALLGRALSALADMGSIILLYLIASRLYGRKVAILASAFSALAVMQIQQSHFFTVDMFANFFMVLTAYFAVEVMARDDGDLELTGWSSSANLEGRIKDVINAYLRNPLVWNVIGFGLALGASVASKINAAPMAGLLPVALLVRYFRQRAEFQKHLSQSEDDMSSDEEQTGPVYAKPVISLGTVIVLVLLGALFSALAFRVFMPYAFSGPGFFGVTPNPKWMQNIADQRAQASGDVDFPPALQWARRSIFYSGYHLAAYGLGWPLAILALLAFVYMGWRMLRGDWREHFLLWSWTGGYFYWQSTQWNPTMRYQLPIYPMLALLSAWMIFNGPWFVPRKNSDKSFGNFLHHPSTRRWVYGMLAGVVLFTTFGWAYAFTRIYTRDHSRVQATRWIYQNVPGPINLSVLQPDGSTQNVLVSLPPNYVLNSAVPFDTQFTASSTGTLTDIYVPNAVNVGNPGSQMVEFSVFSGPGQMADQALARASLTSDFGVLTDPRGQAYTFKLDKPVQVEKGNTYFLHTTSTGYLSLQGSAPVAETSWDDGLPLRMDGYDAYGGLYKGELNFEMYWDDNTEKLNRFLTNLDAGDYIFITSNRQFGTTTRVPERYPLTIAYYRNLLGCPADKEVIWCYNEAVPGMFEGKLGFELVKTFTSYPEIFGFQINTQYADEAFTVYDAPKVLIFKKTDAYSSENVRNILGAVDLSRVVHVTPRQAGRYPGDLMLTPDRLAANRAGGTWSELFNYEDLQNKYPPLGFLIWYLYIGILGLFAWPLVRVFLPGLSDKGYSLSKISGLLISAYLVWMVASLGGQYSRTTIAVVYGLILLAGGVAFYLQREEIMQELRTRGRYYLLVEGVFLALLLIDFAIRLGNPDLWHPARGGERPMDFSYLNAVIKSATFPPYDPWYAGGYINYYYWGFVLVGTPIKMLGIVPSIAYNFVLPTLFALLGLGGFSVVWNLMEEFGTDLREGVNRLVASISGAAGLVLLGNLGTIQLVFKALQKMAVTNEMVDAKNVLFLQRWAWAFQGLGKLFSGGTLPIGWGEYYWAPSRVMPLGDLAITEFPLFTFLYSDLHAHMIALPLTLLVIAWALSTLKARNLSLWSWLATLFFGGLVIGVLRPTNTWDFPTYLIFGVVVTGYALFRYLQVPERVRFGLSPFAQQVALALAGMGLLAGFAVLLYQPFSQWYGLAYSQVSMWTNEKTPITSYWVHWGLFLFVIISWMLWETRQWLAQTPVSALTKLKPYLLLIELGGVLFVVALLGLQFFLNVPIAWFAFPIAVWALILIFRPQQPDAKRLVLFMIGTGILLTLVVEFIVLSGDIGRMNTVFKFYLQVWVLFAISASAGLGWILSEFDQWGRRGRVIFQIGGALLLLGAFMFTLTASMDKIRDRISQSTPFTFDTITYMQYSTYWDQVDLDLSKDYRAIRWMQDHVQGSPVIVEANTPEYRWGTRYTIYTGLPGVVGWNWHQRQQRALFPGEWVSNRIQEITEFYNTGNSVSAEAFLKKYDVKYIVVGELERSIYGADGLAKFVNADGVLWKTVYKDADTVIYEVLP